MDFQSLLEDIGSCEVIQLSAEKPWLKTKFLLNTVMAFLSRKIEVSYFDLDLQFSSLIANTTGTIDFRESLELIGPSEADVHSEMLAFLSREEKQPGGPIIVDSLNTWQNMISKSTLSSGNAVKANHICAIYLTLFQQKARKYSKSIWVTSISKSRPKATKWGSVEWKRTPVGGRMLRFKSDMSMLLTKDDSSIGQMKIEVTSKSSNCKTRIEEGEKILLDDSYFTDSMK